MGGGHLKAAHTRAPWYYMKYASHTINIKDIMNEANICLTDGSRGWHLPGPLAQPPQQCYWLRFLGPRCTWRAFTRVTHW